MRNTLRKASVLTAVVALALTALTACGSDSEDSASTKAKTVTIGYIPWDEDIAVSYLWQHVLQEKGYDVKLQQLDVAPTFVGLEAGDIDVFFDAWLPNTHKDYWAEYGSKLEDLGSWYDSATLNLAVPDYMTEINTIADLKGAAGTFDGTIVGIESGAGLTRVTKAAMKHHGLDQFKLQTSSTAAMLAALKDATDAKKPIVVTLWHPHWAYADFPLKDLKDTESVMGGAEQIHAVGRAGFTADNGEIAAAIKAFKMTDAQLASLEAVVLREFEKDQVAGTKKWAADNADFVSGMLK